jgi:hypothetical protein
MRRRQCAKDIILLGVRGATRAGIGSDAEEFAPLPLVQGLLDVVRHFPLQRRHLD